MDLCIAGKWALVCAASKGLGKGCAQALVREGVNVVITARGTEALEATAAELRALRGRICMIHFKDENCYLGESNGKVKMEPIGEAIREIGYKGWIVLETPCPSKNAEADCRRNAEYSRKLLGL